jgi:hypothetical protein
MFHYFGDRLLYSGTECTVSVKQHHRVSMLDAAAPPGSFPIACLEDRDYRVTNESGGYSLITIRETC